MKLTFDLESRAIVALKNQGMYVYARHPITEIMCFSFKIDDLPPVIWIPEKFRYLLKSILDRIEGELVDDAWVIHAIATVDIIEAHNHGFERIMWHEIMHKRYGFPDLPVEKGRCSAAKASTFGLPRALGKACAALNLEQRKDDVGYKVMMKMCKPRKPIKADKADFDDSVTIESDHAINNNDGTALYYLWHEIPEDFLLLINYCLQDTESEHALSSSLMNITKEELEVWRLDQTINDRGIPIDIAAVKIIMEKVAIKEQKLLLEFQTITGGQVSSARQVAAMAAWMEAQDVKVTNLQKESVNDMLKTQLPDNVRRLLEIRQSLGKSSVAKLKTMLISSNKDNRVRGTFMYYGAGTGRWAGKGMQPHNFVRDSLSEDVIDNILELDIDMIEMLYDGCMIKSASRALRGMICAPPGYEFAVADFSSIEARVLAWLADEMVALQAYERGQDIYKVNAADLYGITYEEVTSDQRQIGKVEELALGYQGWVGAFQNMSSNYGVKVSDERAKEIVTNWRANRPNTVAYWKGIENAAIMAVKTGKQYAYGRVMFGVRGRFLHCRLPGGRLLSYCDPAIRIAKTKYGVEKESISFWGEVKGHWMRDHTYGGKLTENICQAVSRDLLVGAMLRTEDAGYPTIMHVHDELIAEMPVGTSDLKEFNRLLAIVPEWAKGCPINAEGWIGRRYRK